ncbi:MAG TPA: hypothetical protein VJ720_03755, partial [Chitinophaga sp.]|nr:hypothetical protein [Chitinophaga sp.]
MTGKIAKIIEQRTGHQDLIELLADRLSGADLNSLLLEVFARRAEKLTAPALLKQYERNRFVQPADTDYIHLLEKSVQTLKCLSGHGFVPRQMSPLSQLGTCSVIATVSQSKVVSALRNCEVLSDASNALALYISSLKKEHPQSGHLKYCTVQRHVRAQQFNIKGFEPHFTIGCMVSSGMDTGSYTFEKQAIGEHFTALYDLLGTVFKAERIWFKLQPRDNSDLIPHISDYL